MSSSTTFDVIHLFEENEEKYETVLQEKLTREEALNYTEEYICPGLFSGRKFQKVAVHNYVSSDKKARIKIVPRRF